MVSLASSSPYGAPAFFVKKADGSMRHAKSVTGGRLIRVTTKVQACLPKFNIEDLFDCVRGAKYFSKLDLKSGYHHV